MAEHVVGGPEPSTGEQPEIHEFLDQLRQLREDAGRPSFRKMAQKAHYSHTALSAMLSAGRLPSRDLVVAFVRACDGDEARWRERWQHTYDEINAPTPVPAPPRRRRIVVVSGVVAVLLAVAIVVAVVASTSRSADKLADPQACDPLPVADAQVNVYLDELRQVTYSLCAKLPSRSTNRRSGTAELAGHTVSYYAQRNPDGYVELQLSGPPTAGQPLWSAYWQENPPDNPAHPGCSWYQEKVTGQPSEPTWRTTGWLCPAAAGGSTAGCNPVPAADLRLNAYLDRLRTVAQPKCAATPTRTGARLAAVDGRSTGTASLDGQPVSYLVQRDGDGFVRLQLSGPATRTRGRPDWSVAWQWNPPSDPTRPACGSYQEQVDSADGQPPWQTSGWSCP